MRMLCRTRVIKFFIIFLTVHFVIFVWFFKGNAGTSEYGEFNREILPSGPIPGLEGKPYVINKDALSGLQVEEYKIGYQHFGFNKYASDRIPSNRTLEDIRVSKCQDYRALSRRGLPQLSVVMVVQDVPRSILRRCIRSIIDRTPDDLLERIIIVNNFSQLSETVDALREIANNPKVTIENLTEDVGGTVATSVAVLNAESRGTVVFLVDPYIEVMHGWAEPILHFLETHKRSFAVPTIDVLDKDTLEYVPTAPERGPDQLNGFNWFFDMVRVRISEKEIGTTKPYRQPTEHGIMAFWFEYVHSELSASFDERYKTPGTQHLDLSFRTWLCGEGIYHVPCSRVGKLTLEHVQLKDEQAKYNQDRVMDGYLLGKHWTGGYVDHFCQRMKKDQCKDLDALLGKTIQEEIKAKEVSKCKTFDWYMKNVATSVYVPKDIVRSGQVINEGYGLELCLDHNPSVEHGKITVEECTNQVFPKSQFFMLTKTGHFRQDAGCISYDGSRLQKQPCIEQDENQEWAFEQENALVHQKSRLCLTVDKGYILITLRCNDELTQRWKFGAT